MNKADWNKLEKCFRRNDHSENRFKPAEDKVKEKGKKKPGGKERRKENDLDEDLTNPTTVSNELSVEAIEK